MEQYSGVLHYHDMMREPGVNSSQFNFSSAADIVGDFVGNMYTYNRFTNIVLLTLYAPIFVLGLAGNILIIVSVSTDTGQKPSLYFLVNLALSDLAVTVMCIPTSVGTIVYKLWVFGRFLCKFTAFIQAVAVAVSVFSMTAMAVDRYVSIRHPGMRRLVSAKHCLVLTLAMWLIASLFMAPLIFVRELVTADIPYIRPLQYCIETWPESMHRQAYGVFLLFVVFIIPASTIAICYGHVGKVICGIEEKIQRSGSSTSVLRFAARRRAARMVIILICVFMVCWLPYNSMSAVSDLSETALYTEVLPFVLWLGHAHSAINPLLYWSLHKRFRDNIHRIRLNMCTSSTHSDTYGVNV